MPVRGQGFASLHTASEAQSILLSHQLPKLPKETIRTADAMGRVLAETLHAPFDQPGFRRAAMDGYAIKAEDSYGASETNPLQLKIVGKVEIGDTETQPLDHGEAVRISTGAPLPDDATGVIRIEDCERLGNVVEIYAAIPEGKNIAAPDEDVAKGQIVLKEGTRLQPWDIGILESLSFEEISVYRKPRVATLSTGNELISSGETPKQGQVVDSNRPAINGWIQQMGGDLVASTHCKDEFEIIKQSIVDLASIVDLIITTGGTSVGSKDYLAEAIADLGDLWVHGITVRPGKPVALGQIKHDEGSTPIIALPGYPLAAFLNFHLFGSAFLQQWTKQRPLLDKKTVVTLGDKVASKVGVTDFVRLKDTEEGAKLIRVTGAGILSSIVHADYLLVIPDDLEGYNAGEMVEVYQLR